MTNGTKTQETGRNAAEAFGRLESDVYALLDMTRDAMDALAAKADRHDGGHFTELSHARTYLVNALAEISGKNHDAIVEALDATHESKA